MKAKCFALAIVSVLVFTVASAQEYSIRANRGLNLRASPSLYAEIAGTVRSGAILQVVDHVADWLKINRGGNEVWLADWVNYSRVEGSGETATRTPTTANIDNCCFVDRQCHSNQEWIAGYWAYQNNQCPTPTRSQTQTTTQPTSSASAEVDNCCYVDRHCQSSQQWTDGFWAYQNNQCGAPERESSVGIVIAGSETFVTRISAALELLRIRAPQWHAYVTKGPLKIVEAQASASDGYAHANSIYISPSAAAKPAHVLAELLVHEAAHVQRSLAGLFRYATVQQQNLEESIAGYVSSAMRQQINYGRMIMTYTPSQVARLTRFGRLELPTRNGGRYVTFVTGEARQLLRAGIDVFGAVRAEIARAARLLG